MNRDRYLSAVYNWMIRQISGWIMKNFARLLKKEWNPADIFSQGEYVPHNVQFDFYQGGGLDVAFLGLAETAPNGDLNVSKFGTRLAGAGGFIDITQNAKKVVYCGTFTAKGLKTECKDGKLVITQEGAKKKFVKQVEHITFSGDYANEVHQPVLYITERCVFELRPEGVTLTEIAPGTDLQTQILDQMEFVPKMADEIKTMDARIFRDELMGLAND